MVKNSIKKVQNWMLAAILICGTSVFTSCSSDSDDNPVINPDEPQQQLADTPSSSTVTAAATSTLS